MKKDAFKTTIKTSWKLQGKENIKEVGQNLFIFEFQVTLDLVKVQNGRPWSFDRNLLCLITFDGKLAPNHIRFTKEPMWV